MIDQAGKAVTVLGAVEPDDLGMTITHEHLLHDLRASHLPYQRRDLSFLVTDEDYPATELARYGAKVGLGNLHEARRLAPIWDNYCLDDEDLATREVGEYKRHGGGAIVDVTSIGLKRDPLAVRRVSKATGLHIVMGTGWYQKLYHPSNMDDLTVEDMTDRIVRDVTEGIDGTGVRSGIVGEIGVNGRPIVENEEKSVRAAARASRLTGAAISFHGPTVQEERHRVPGHRRGGGRGPATGRHGPLRLPGLRGARADAGASRPRRLHRAGHAGQGGGHRNQPDRDGRQVDTADDRRGGTRSASSSPTTSAGKIHLKHYGGFGYSFIPEQLLPHLREIGVSEERIDRMMVQNPKRILTFAEPRP